MIVSAENQAHGLLCYSVPLGNGRLDQSSRAPRRQSQGLINAPAHRPACAALRLVFLGDILGRIAPIGQRVPLTDQPGIQIRPVRGVTNTERPQVAVPALNRAGDRVRTDPRPERLSGVIPTRVAPLACRQDCADSGASIP